MLPRTSLNYTNMYHRTCIIVYHSKKMENKKKSIKSVRSKRQKVGRKHRSIVQTVKPENVAKMK
jgi:hypothetical protein